MTSTGTHTWKRSLYYHRCPACGYIFESRQDFEYRLGAYQKDLHCPRCQQAYTLTKIVKPQAGPFFGEAEGAEITWS